MVSFDISFFILCSKKNETCIACTKPVCSQLYNDDVSLSETWEKRWIQSTNKGEAAGKFVLSHGKFYGDAEKDKGKNKGILLTI